VLLGAAIEAAAGGVAGAVTDLGIDDRFMKELGESLPQDGAALFVLVRKVTPDMVIPRISGYGGRVIQSSLSGESASACRRRWPRAARTARAGTTSPRPRTASAGIGRPSFE
jgi:uncharacterized membrane protein